MKAPGEFESRRLLFRKPAPGCAMDVVCYSYVSEE